MHNLGAMRRGKARSYFDVIARSEATKQSILAFMSRDGLLRFARNDGSWRCHAKISSAQPYKSQDFLRRA
jgi:hypothetical protein